MALAWGQAVQTINARMQWNRAHTIAAVEQLPDIGRPARHFSPTSPLIRRFHKSNPGQHSALSFGRLN